MPLPTSATVPRERPVGSYVSWIRRGGSSEPSDTPRSAPSPSFSIATSSSTVIVSPSRSATSLASCANRVGVIAPAGSLTRSRANATASATRCAAIERGLPGADDRDGFDPRPLALALVGGEAIRRERDALGDSLGGQLLVDRRRQRGEQRRRHRRGVARGTDQGRGGAADRVDGDLARLAHADGDHRRGVVGQQGQHLPGLALELPLRQVVEVEIGTGAVGQCPPGEHGNAQHRRVVGDSSAGLEDHCSSRSASGFASASL